MSPSVLKTFFGILSRLYQSNGQRSFSHFTCPRETQHCRQQHVAREIRVDQTYCWRCCTSWEPV